VDFRVDIFLEALTSKSLRDGALIAVALTIVSFVAGSGIGLIVALGGRAGSAPFGRWRGSTSGCSAPSRRW